MMNKLTINPKLLKLLAFGSGGVIFAYSLFLSPINANAQNIKSLTGEGNQFLRDIENLKSRANQQFQGIANEFNNGLGKLSTEIQSQLNSRIQSQIDALIGDLGLPDLIKTGEKIEDTISKTKTDILQISPVIQGKNAKTEWNQKYTIKQSETVLGLEGQKAMKQESEISQAAANISLDNANSAQGDFITQEIMKKIALQNAQTTAVLKSVQGNLQEQNRLTATANVNLVNISENLTLEQKRQQYQSQGLTNAVYRNAAFLDGYFATNK